MVKNQGYFVESAINQEEINMKLQKNTSEKRKQTLFSKFLKKN